ncbi:MAG TPA: cupin domain-containing protein [Thermoanaerobaculia bacterium]|nr:cupin domain-containing protein [Thermoanaerobaculia bacterium]
MSQEAVSPFHLPLRFLEPFLPGPGMEVHEIDLAPGGASLAPFKASRFTVAPGQSSPVDSHAVHEIWFFTAGSGELTYDGEAHRLAAPEACYFAPHRTHTIRNDGEEEIAVISLWWS